MVRGPPAQHLFCDTIDSAAYASSLSIRQTGDPDEVDGITTFEPIWDAGPASREDGQQLLSGVKVVGSGGISFLNQHTGTADDYNFFEEVVYDDTITTAAEAQLKAESILNFWRFEWRTYSCSLLVPYRVHLIRPGQNITIQAKAIPDADDAVVTRRKRRRTHGVTSVRRVRPACGDLRAVPRDAGAREAEGRPFRAGVLRCEGLSTGSRP